MCDGRVCRGCVCTCAAVSHRIGESAGGERKSAPMKKNGLIWSAMSDAAPLLKIKDHALTRLQLCENLTCAFPRKDQIYDCIGRSLEPCNPFKML